MQPNAAIADPKAAITNKTPPQKNSYKKLKIFKSFDTIFFVKNFFFKNAASFFFASFFLIFAFSCASSKRSFENFFEENSKSLKEFSLSNGIRCVIKNIPSEKNIELRLLFAGGASVCPKNKSGLDLLTFNLICKSAAANELASHAKYFPVSICENDFSACGFSCAAADFEEGLSAFCASLFEADFSHEDYLKEESDFSNEALDKNENIRYALLSAVSENLLSSHPYFDGIFYTTQSRVSEYDIEENLKSLLDANRIAIVAAGNFSSIKNIEKRSKKNAEEFFLEQENFLQEIFEEHFGKISKKEFSAPKIPSINLAEKKDKKVPFEFAGNSYCAALCLKCPARGSDDYEAFALSTLALDFVLRRDVVEKERAALFCGTAVLNGKESLALIVASGINEGRDIKNAINSALKNFLSKEELEPLLERFKNIYANKIYSSSQNAFFATEQIASSIFYEKDAAAFLKRPEKIRTQTAADVIAAFEKYFLSEETFFAEVSGK